MPHFIGILCPYHKKATAVNGPNSKKAKNLGIFGRAVRKGICAASVLFVPIQQINKNSDLVLVPEMKPKWFKDILITAVLGGVFCCECKHMF